MSRFEILHNDSVSPIKALEDSRNTKSLLSDVHYFVKIILNGFVFLKTIRTTITEKQVKMIMYYWNDPTWKYTGRPQQHHYPASRVSLFSAFDDKFFINEITKSLVFCNLYLMFLMKDMIHFNRKTILNFIWILEMPWYLK